MVSAHQANTIVLLSFNSIILTSNTIQSYHQREIRVIIMPKSEKTITQGKSIVLSPEKTLGKVGRKSKVSRTDAASTHSTVSLSLTSTPKSNLSATSSKLLTSNGLFCNTMRTLNMDNICTTPTSQVKISSKVQKQAYSVIFCNSSETLAECLKYVTDPESVPKDQESQLRFLLD
jgi:hypothetical protein